MTPQLKFTSAVPRSLRQRLRSASVAVFMTAVAALVAGCSDDMSGLNQKIAEIKAQMANPPSHLEERQAISALLALLQRRGVAVALREPIKTGAALRDRGRDLGRWLRE